MERRVIPTTGLSNFIFFSLLCHELSPLHIKEVLYTSSLTFPICQHHDPYDFGPLLNKIYELFLGFSTDN